MERWMEKDPMLLHTGPESFYPLKGLMWICTWYTFAENWEWICIILLLLLTVFNPANIHTFLFSLLFAAWTQQTYVQHFWRFTGAEETRSTSQETPSGTTTARKRPGTLSNCSLLKMDYISLKTPSRAKQACRQSKLACACPTHLQLCYERDLIKKV